jgi:hypothetical protein
MKYHQSKRTYKPAEGYQIAFEAQHPRIAILLIIAIFVLIGVILGYGF